MTNHLEQLQGMTLTAARRGSVAPESCILTDEFSKPANAQWAAVGHVYR